MGNQVLYHSVLIDNEEAGKMVWRDQKPERKCFLPKGKTDLVNELCAMEFKFDPSDKLNLKHALLQAILTDAVDPSRPVRKYYGAWILPSEKSIFISNVRNIIPWHLLETYNGAPSEWKKIFPELEQNLSYIWDYVIDEPNIEAEFEYAKKIIQNDVFHRTDGELRKIFSIDYDFGSKKLKLLKQELNDKFSWIRSREKELDQYYTGLEFKKEEIALLRSHNVKTVYDVCCGCLPVLDKSVTYFGNDKDPNVSITGASHLDTFTTPINDLLKSMKSAGPVHLGNLTSGEEGISTNPPFSKQKINGKRVSPLDYLYDSWLNETDMRYLGVWMAEDYMSCRKYRCIEIIKTKVKDWPGLKHDGSSQKEKLIVYLLFDRQAPEVEKIDDFEFVKPKDAVFDRKIAKLPNDVLKDLCSKHDCYWWKFQKKDGQFWKFDNSLKQPTKINITDGTKNIVLKFGDPLPDGFKCGQTQTGGKNNGAYYNEERTELYRKWLSENQSIINKI